MELETFTKFCSSLSINYGCDEASIYYVNRQGEIELLAGLELDKFTVEQYFKEVNKPKYFVAESSKPLQGTMNLFSRFVFCTTSTSGIQYLFVVSSKQKNAFENTTKDILKDILTFKARV